MFSGGTAVCRWVLTIPFISFDEKYSTWICVRKAYLNGIVLMPCIMLICMLQIHWAFDTTNIIYQKINNFISILTRQMNQSVSCCLQILIVYSFLESWFPWIVWLCPTAAIAYIMPFYLVSLYIFLSFFLFHLFVCYVYSV